MSTAIDASLKPIMTTYLRGLEARLRGAGFAGRVLIITSQGGVMDAASIAETPVQLVNSGPSLGPVGALAYGSAAGSDTLIVGDAGGTTFDVSLVRHGRIPRTRETWLGRPLVSHMTGMPSVDVRSIGAGGGSIAFVDRGGLLHVGPISAGAVPGPAAYGRGGQQADRHRRCPRSRLRRRRFLPRRRHGARSPGGGGGAQAGRRRSARPDRSRKPRPRSSSSPPRTWSRRSWT